MGKNGSLVQHKALSLEDLVIPIQYKSFIKAVGKKHNGRTTICHMSLHDIFYKQDANDMVIPFKG